jgi:hypothetical protein
MISGAQTYPLKRHGQLGRRSRARITRGPVIKLPGHDAWIERSVRKSAVEQFRSSHAILPLTATAWA